MESPQCPWCGDEVSDSPDEDFPAVDPYQVITECGGCGKPVAVTIEVQIHRSATKVEAEHG